MKFGKITSPKLAENALYLGGAFGGGAISGGLMTLVPAEQKIYARGGIILLGLLGASTLNPKTSGESLAQAIAIGMGIRQASEVVKELTQDKIQVTAESTTTDKFVAGMAGLACPCDETRPMLASPVINFPSLNPGSNPVLMASREVEVQDVPVSLLG
ncbi:hypothetical protein ACNKXS_03360 [Christiangramia marina]|uniref:hypothetical protein n=1 Tax=Christiangramia marina TaxID=409436 RepID=UPI003AA94586